jgi:N-acetylglucosamine kinase-like BadF-type ATPase
MRVDAATASLNLESALAQLSAQTGVSMASITRTCIGTAGESVPLVRDWLQASFSTRVGGGLLILGDVEIALEAAFPGRSGVLAMAGTGSNVLGRTNGGLLVTAGGWGPALADQGSGHRIGLESLRALFLAKDEERPTSLLSAVMDYWELSSLDALVEYANSQPAPDFSKLTAVVVHCAELGDETALAVLRQQAEELAYLVRLVIRRLRLASKEHEWTPPIAFTGSILENVTLVREALIAAVQREFPSAQAPDKVVDPLEGALWRARTGSFL